jgi:hypothetical protein
MFGSVRRTIIPASSNPLLSPDDYNNHCRTINEGKPHQKPHNDECLPRIFKNFGILAEICLFNALKKIKIS